MYHGFHKNIMEAQLFSTLIIIKNISWATNQRRIISVTLKTEVMAAENSAFAITEKYIFKIYYNRNVIFNSNNIS